MKDTGSLASLGIPGLDDIVGGGLLRDRSYLIQGKPGSGKTTLSMQFLMEGLRCGERCLYVTLSETLEELHGFAASHGWDLDGLAVMELSAIEDIMDAQQQTTMLYPTEIDLSATMKRIMADVDRVQPQRIVFDSLTELRLLAQDPLRFRRQLLVLKNVLQQRRATVLLLDDRSLESEGHQVQSVVHGVISLASMPTSYGVMHRRLIVDKFRGVAYRTGYHDYTIVTGGCVVFPRLIASEHHAPHSMEPMRSGIAELDTMLGAGIQRGSSLLILGPAGSGKSSIATAFLRAAATRGERAVVWGFEETEQVFLERSRGLGLDLDQLLESGRIIYHTVDPASISAGELSHKIRTDVEEHDAALVVIDSLTGYLSAMPVQEHLHLHLHELLTYLNRLGVVSVMTLAQHGLLGPAESSAADVSYIADCVLLLRFFEAYGTVRKAASVIKKRTGGHESTIREFMMASGELQVGDPLADFQGVLTGTPLYRGERERLFKEP